MTKKGHKGRLYKDLQAGGPRMVLIILLCVAAGFAIGDIISSVIAGTDLVIVSIIKKIKAVFSRITEKNKSL